ncbi:hypothetical protein [Candidatus Avelusimicrobium gallicola]|nr:hypothetical protein [Elusimicrobium sp. An273]
MLTLHRAVMNLPKQGLELLGMDKKSVCNKGKACKHISVDFGN